MKLTGEEKARLCIEIDNKEEWTNTQFTIKELLDSYILGSIAAPIKNNEKVQEKIVKYFSINNTIMDKRSRINAKFRVSLNFPKNEKESIEFECVCTYLDICDFYNFIVDLYVDYAKSFNRTVTDINLKMIEIEIKNPLAFTNKGFINSNVLKQYDLDGQIDILLHLLKNQKWEIINDKIIFTELINDKFIQTLLEVFEKEAIIDNEEHKNMIIDNCEIMGIKRYREDIQNKLQKEKEDKDKLETIINNNQDFYTLNLKKYKPRFTKLGNKNSKPIIIF